ARGAYRRGTRMSTPPPRRVEGADKVTGQARYSADVRLPGMLHGAILRCPLPHARLRRIDTARAEALEGVYCVLDARNAPPIAWYGDSRLFDDTLRFAGDEVAAVAAATEEIAADALRAIDVEYEPLPFAAGFDAVPVQEDKVRGRGDVAA